MIKHINKNDMESIMDLLNAMNDKTRQQIIMVFQSQKEYRANDIAGHFSLSRPTISHHLNLMKRAKILSARKKGKEIYYSFNKAHVIGSMEALIKYLKSCC